MRETPIPPVRGAGTGLAFAIGAYVLWGVLPLYFLLLSPASAFEIVSWRIVMTLVFCVFLITATKGWRSFRAQLRDTRTSLTLGLAGILILANWLVYVFATLSGHVVEAALGYFINPIVTVLLGVFVLRERLRPLQWLSIGISTVAVLVLALNYGAIPWVALALAFSFGLYGLIKKRIGGRVDAIAGLTIESAWLAPAASITLLVLGVTSNLSMGSEGAAHAALLAVSGIVTGVPLLLFAAAARRLPLTALGLTQYIAPIMQFLIGVFLLREEMPAARWVGFALVWVALIVLSIDVAVTARANRRASPSGP